MISRFVTKMIIGSNRIAMTGFRSKLISEVCEQINARDKPHPLRIAIDGVDAAGKTTFANELALSMKGQREIIRSSVDAFHNSKDIRYRKGSLSSLGYYMDSFDYPQIINNLLRPLGPEGSRSYKTTGFDHYTDQPVESIPQNAPDGAVLLFDGIFLLRPELRPFWDFTIFLQVPFSVTLSRALERDQEDLGDQELLRQQYVKRYIPGQELYLREVRPGELADIVIDNSKPHAPVFLR